jgi:hypothetical protein
LLLARRGAGSGRREEPLIVTGTFRRREAGRLRHAGSAVGVGLRRVERRLVDRRARRFGELFGVLLDELDVARDGDILRRRRRRAMGLEEPENERRMEDERDDDGEAQASCLLFLLRYDDEIDLLLQSDS